jgi:colicin import membrane protein
MYNLIVTCTDGKADVTMTRIHYLYEEERNPQAYRAEEWITDKEALNKKQTKLARISGKFRRKTIDRKDFLFNKLAELMK